MADDDKKPRQSDEYEAELLDYKPLASAKQESLEGDFVNIRKAQAIKATCAAERLVAKDDLVTVNKQSFKSFKPAKGSIFIGRMVDEALWMKDGLPDSQKAAEQAEKVKKNVSFEDSKAKEEQGEKKGWRKYFKAFKKN